MPPNLALAHLLSIEALARLARRSLETPPTRSSKNPNAVSGQPGIGTVLGSVGAVLSKQISGSGNIGSSQSQIWLGEQVFNLGQEEAKRIVVVKIINLKDLQPADRDIFAARFICEARALLKFNCPFICELYAAGCEEEFCWLIMEHMEDGDLREYLEKHGALPYPSFLRWAEQLLCAVVYAHDHGFVHRDIKPGNIFRSWAPYDHGDIKLGDFGIALLSRQQSSLTQAGSILGTPWYMSPEQAQQKPIGTFSDVYAIGSTFYHLLAGQVPFPGETLANVVRQIAEGKPVQPLAEVVKSDVPPAMVSLVEQMMAVATNDRPTVQEALTEVYRLQNREIVWLPQRLAATNAFQPPE